MKVKVFITIDTEEDTWDAYKATGNKVENVYRIPELQNLFDRYNAVPTYLINWPVVMDEKARDILKGIYDDGRCEIGTHCHPWNTPPYEEEINKFNSMMCNLPPELVKKKMERLHFSIVEHLNLIPVCFRAGRWGFNGSVALIIKNLGYKIDSSISPFVDWSEYHGPDFSRGHSKAYMFEPDNLMEPGQNGSLLEVPPTVGFFQKNGRFCYSLKKRLRGKPLSRLRLLGILDRMRLLNFRWLSPELSSGPDMVRLAKQFVRSGHRFLNMTFHSTSMLPGMGPFVEGEKTLKQFLSDIETFLEYASEHGFEFSPLSGAMDGECSGPRLKCLPFICGGKSVTEAGWQVASSRNQL